MIFLCKKIILAFKKYTETLYTKHNADHTSAVTYNADHIRFVTETVHLSNTNLITMNNKLNLYSLITEKG
jgi:hypothetical protein